MSRCTIHYKFKSSSANSSPYTALSFAGQSARLLSVIRSILTHRKISLSGRDFNLVCIDGETAEEYRDYNQMMGGGTKLVVRRVPCEKGMGVLGAISRADAGIRGGPVTGLGEGGTNPGGSVVVQGAGEREVFRDVGEDEDDDDEEDEDVLEGFGGDEVSFQFPFYSFIFERRRRRRRRRGEAFRFFGEHWTGL